MPGATVESLLYDFNLNLGDTVHSLLLSLNLTCNSSIDTVTVYAIDSILINGSYRKAWQYVGQFGCFFFPVVEGVGSLNGLIDNLSSFEEGGTLICVKNDSANYYFTSSILGCNFIQSLNSLSSAFDVEIYSNPFEQTLKLKIKDEFAEKIILTINNMYGQPIYKSEERITHELNKSIDLSTFSFGTYFLKLIDNRNQTLYKKVVKAN